MDLTRCVIDRVFVSLGLCLPFTCIDIKEVLDLSYGLNVNSVDKMMILLRFLGFLGETERQYCLFSGLYAIQLGTSFIKILTRVDINTPVRSWPIS